MVLEIRLGNFFSIKEEIVLDLRAGNINTQRAKALRNNVFEYGKTRVLKTIAMYGANASGKSNIIKAIRFCNSMVFTSHQFNEDKIFPFQPFKFEGYPGKPSTYFIRFVSNGIEYEYAFSLTTKEIVTESLFYYPKGRRAKVFTRDERLGPDKRAVYSFGDAIRRPLDVAENTSRKTLYISRASQMDRAIGKEIFNYFLRDFILGYKNFDDASLEVLLKDYKEPLLQALRMADSDIVDYKIEKVLTKGKIYNLQPDQASVEDIEEKKLQVYTYHRTAPDVPFNFMFEESDGTKKLFLIMLTLLKVITENRSLIIDEIESSLHPNIVQYIIDLFHASDHAQLIFATHNTKLLDLKKLRKDQIFFVNKKEDGSTDLYSLYDFKDFRDTMDVEKAYLQGRFDAVPFIDDSREQLNTIVHG